MWAAVGSTPRCTNGGQPKTAACFSNLAASVVDLRWVGMVSALSKMAAPDETQINSADDNLRPLVRNHRLVRNSRILGLQNQTCCGVENAFQRGFIVDLHDSDLSMLNRRLLAQDG